MDFKFNLKNTILVIVFALLVIIAVVLINKNNPTFTKKEKGTYSKINIVKNYSNFYTVNSCVYRYLTYVANENKTSILNVLDEEYVNSNNITEENVLSFLTKYEGNISFESVKMYEEEINKNITKYYVKGNVINDIIDSDAELTEAYFIVKLDKKEQVFSIMPYNGEVFK